MLAHEPQVARVTEIAPVAVPSPSRGYLAAKRIVDVVLGSLALVALLPLLLLIAFLVMWDSGRPVLFKQERIGARPRRTGSTITWEISSFCMYKFRTMRVDASISPLHENFVRAFLADELPTGASKLIDDPRVTRIGSFLRSTSLDELPQLLNVLEGSMSLVGPRPVPPYEVAGYDERHLQRLAAVPGMTGLWQVKGRGRTTFEEMVHMDLEYIRASSLWLDMELLARTVPSVLTRRGAK